MNKEELIPIVDRVWINWKQPQLPPDEMAAVYRVWWRYLGSLNKDEVERVVDEMVLRDAYKPRVGEIFRAVKDRQFGEGAPPSEEEAYLQAEEMVAASQQGVVVREAPHPIVVDTIRTVREKSGRTFTRRAFIEEYQKKLSERYGIDDATNT